MYRKALSKLRSTKASLKHWLISNPPISQIPSEMLFYGIQSNIIDNHNNVFRLAHPSPPVDPVSSKDLEIAKRVLSSYHLAFRDNAGMNSATPRDYWASIIGNHYTPLLATLAMDNPESLARLLNGMFALPITRGLSMEGNLSYLGSESGQAFLLNWWMDQILSMASYLGLIPEEAENGRIMPERCFNLSDLYGKIEDYLGTDLIFPRVCAAWGIEFRSKLMPVVSWRHLHSAHVLASLSSPIHCPKIVEVGAGFGGVCYWLHKMSSGKIRYVIYDFPILNVIAGYFLLKAMPGMQVTLFGEPYDPTSEEPCVAVLPQWLIEKATDLGTDIVFNQDSLPEMPADTAVAYLKIFDRIARIGFYSENQESGQLWNPSDANSEQLKLPAIDKAMTNLEREYRYRAWMRKGYFESFYRRKKTYTAIDKVTS